MRRALTALLLLLLLTLPLAALGELPSGVTAHPRAESDSAAFLQRVALHPWTDDGQHHSIHCFDVNENGDVAVGLQAQDWHVVAVYDREGAFRYGHAFQCTGSWRIEWVDAERIAIYFHRSQVVAVVDAQSVCTAIAGFEWDSDTNRHLSGLQSTQRTVNGEVYRMDANLGILSPLALSYARVVRLAADGQAYVVVDMGRSSLAGVLLLGSVVVFLIVVGVTMAKKRRAEPPVRRGLGGS